MIKKRLPECLQIEKQGFYTVYGITGLALLAGYERSYPFQYICQYIKITLYLIVI